ncbi:MAG: nucleotidyltransferase domain-containing protein [Acidobacteria bacterium]|nr:nucleotidyltransferase domain-containing protein [Acidobacteriota bacterium]
MGLPAALAGRLCAVAETQPAVRALYAFGSRQDGGAGPDADLDLGVLYTEPRRLETTLRLEELLDRVSPYAVDLVDVSRASAFLALAVVRGDRLFTRHPLEADRFELYVLRRAGDLLPFERERRAMLLSPRR